MQEFLALKHFQFNNFINNYCECILKSRSVVALHLVNRRCWGLRWTLWKCGRCLRSAAADSGSTSAFPSVACLPVASSATSFCWWSELNQRQMLFLISIFSKNVVNYFSESKCWSMDREICFECSMQFLGILIGDFASCDFSVLRQRQAVQLQRLKP